MDQSGRWPDSRQCTVMNWTIFEVVLVIDLLLHTSYIAMADSKCQALGGRCAHEKERGSSCLKKHVGTSFSQSRHQTIQHYLDTIFHTRQVSENCYASSRATSDGANVDVAAASSHQRSWREVGRVPQPLYSTLTDSLPNVIAMYGMTIAVKFKKCHLVSKWQKMTCY